MDTDTLRSALEQIGLTQYEADAYLTLVDLGSATAVEIAGKSQKRKTTRLASSNGSRRCSITPASTSAKPTTRSRSS